MAPRKTIIPCSVASTMLINAGAERVSKGAGLSFAKYLESFAFEIGKTAVAVAKHSGKKTVDKDDIAFALRK